jgi:peptidoglycan hydrolase-like protein with peptidoglycan-binding domain
VGIFLRYEGDRVWIRGGNQSNQVCDDDFAASRIVAIRRADPSKASGRATIQIGDKGAFVLDAQKQLQDLRYFPGKLDGDFGSLTDAAARSFQADHGLEVDGVIGNRTWAALAEAKPKQDRDVTMKDLRKAGSETIKAADKAEAGVAVGSIATGLALVTQVSEQAKQATTAIGEAQNTLNGLQSMVLAYWPLIAVSAVLGGVWWTLREIKARRLQDARTGANVAR